MWQVVGPARAEFRASDWVLTVSSVPQTDAAGGGPTEITGGGPAETAGKTVAGEVRFQVSRQSGDAAPTHAAEATVRLPGYRLPACGDCFIRGEELHLSFPVADDDRVGLHLVLLAIEAGPQQLVIESVLGVHTELLESFPELHLSAPDAAGTSGSPPADGETATVIWQPAASAKQAAAAADSPPHSGGTQPLATTVLCDLRDRSSLAADWTAAEPAVRFWGDFLEKGVIRKVQPWWVWSTQPPSSQAIQQIAEQLADRPLPLVS